MLLNEKSNCQAWDMSIFLFGQGDPRDFQNNIKILPLLVFTHVNYTASPNFFAVDHRENNLKSSNSFLHDN